MFSQHAIHRAHQRSIPVMIIDLLINYGAAQHDHLGAKIYYFDKKAWKAVDNNAGHQVTAFLRKLYNDTCAIISNDGTIITVERRYKHINHH